jgi:plastocyanin
MELLMTRIEARLQSGGEAMGKRIRVLSSALALGALLGSVFIGAVGVSAAKSAKPLAGETCVFVCQGDGFKIYTIGVDNKNPATKNFEYTDFFPNGFKQTTTATSSLPPPNLKIQDGDVLHFLWNPDASLDSAHTVTFPAGEETLAAAQTKYEPLIPDADDGAGKFMGNPLTFNPTSTDCGTADNPCEYDGSHNLNSGFLTNHNGTANPSEFYVKVFFDMGSGQSATVNFFCALHRGMVGQVKVFGGETNTTTEEKMAANALAQYTTETAAGIAAETAANQTAVSTNSDGSKTVTMTAGTAAPHVEVMEMLPNNVSIKAGDKVTWVDKGFDIHTVTFPKGSGSDSADPFQSPVCEGTGTTDTPAPSPGGPPPFGCDSPQAVELPIDLGPKGPTAIASTSTVASSGIILSAAAGAPLPDRYTFSFPNAGTFAYMCRVHDNMTGTIAVAALPAAPAPPVLPATGGGSPWHLLPLLLGTLAILFGLAVLRLRSLTRL